MMLQLYGMGSVNDILNCRFTAFQAQSPFRKAKIDRLIDGGEIDGEIFYLCVTCDNTQNTQSANTKKN